MQENLTSPLTEVDGNSLAELFARDPFQLSQQDIEKICAELRAQRVKWQQEEGVKAKGAKPKVSLSAAEMSSILDSL